MYSLTDDFGYTDYMDSITPDWAREDYYKPAVADNDIWNILDSGNSKLMMAWVLGLTKGDFSALIKAEALQKTHEEMPGYSNPQHVLKAF